MVTWGVEWMKGLWRQARERQGPPACLVCAIYTLSPCVLPIDPTASTMASCCQIKSLLNCLWGKKKKLDQFTGVPETIHREEESDNWFRPENRKPGISIWIGLFPCQFGRERLTFLSLATITSTFPDQFHWIASLWISPTKKASPFSFLISSLLSLFLSLTK